MRHIHLISSGIMAVLLLAASASAEPQAAQPVAIEQISSGMLTVTPTQPSVASRLSVSGPEGYEATVWAENGGAVSVNLMAEGRFPVEKGTDPDSVESVPGGRQLPDGRYRYEAVFYAPDGGQRAQMGVFFVQNGAARAREAQRSELLRVRTALTESPNDNHGGVGAEYLAVDDFLSVHDSSGGGDGVTNVYLRSVTGGDPGEIIALQNAHGDWVFKAGLPQLANEIRPFTVTSDSQNVGIGTTNPQADLHIFRPTGVIRITDSDPCPNPNASWQMQEFNGSMLFSVVDNCAGDSVGSKMLIDGNGRVGIGTTNPTQELHVVSSDGGDIRLSGSAQGEEWDIGINSANGSLNVNDTTTAGNAVTIEMGTPEQTLRLNSAGQVGIGTPSPSAKLHVAGSGRIDGDVALGSSRTLKTAFESIDHGELLARVADLPLASWRYKSEDESARHIGPFAEDFQRLFGLGDGATISVIDAQGVTLAAIQGLQQELAEKEAAIARLRSQNAELEARLTSVEERLKDSR